LSELIALLQVEGPSCEPSWAGFNVAYGIAVMRDIASRVTSGFRELQRMASEKNMAMVFKEPLGPSLLISP